MKLEERLEFISTIHTRCCDLPGERGALTGAYSPEEIMAEFEKKGIGINPNESEKKVVYGKDRHANITALEVIFPARLDPVVTQYILRAGKLEVSIEDYRSEPVSDHPGHSIVLGGGSRHSEGVVCTIKMEGSSADAQRIEDVKAVLTDLYQSPRLYKALLQESGNTEPPFPSAEQFKKGGPEHRPEKKY